MILKFDERTGRTGGGPENKAWRLGEEPNGVVDNPNARVVVHQGDQVYENTAGGWDISGGRAWQDFEDPLGGVGPPAHVPNPQVSQGQGDGTNVATGGAGDLDNPGFPMRDANPFGYFGTPELRPRAVGPGDTPSPLKLRQCNCPPVSSAHPCLAD